MPRGIDAFRAELGLEHADPTGYEWGDDPASRIDRAGLDHEMLAVAVLALAGRMFGLY